MELGVLGRELEGEDLLAVQALELLKELFLVKDGQVGRLPGGLRGARRGGGGGTQGEQGGLRVRGGSPLADYRSFVRVRAAGRVGGGGGRAAFPPTSLPPSLPPGLSCLPPAALPPASLPRLPCLPGRGAVLSQRRGVRGAGRPSIGASSSAFPLLPRAPGTPVLRGASPPGTRSVPRPALSARSSSLVAWLRREAIRGERRGCRWMWAPGLERGDKAGGRAMS